MTNGSPRTEALRCASAGPTLEPRWGSPRGMWARRPIGITISPLDRQRTCKQQLTVQTQEREQKPPQTPVRTGIPGLQSPTGPSRVPCSRGWCELP